jgi:5,10-methylenetetrahydromethanopterin reductase
VPADERHLAIHDLHLVGVNDRDRAIVSPELITMLGAAYRPEELRERVAALEVGGLTEVAYQPAGTDIPRELEAFASALRA